jgi:hypothetical protein
MLSKYLLSSSVNGQELEAIIALGREGKWTDAEKESLRLAEAQHP